MPFRFAPLIKLAVFVFIVWNVAGWMLTIPEVFALKERLQAGQFSEEDVLAARDAIGARIQTFLRNAQDPNPPPSGSQPPAEAPPEPTRPVAPSVSEQSDCVRVGAAGGRRCAARRVGPRRRRHAAARTARGSTNIHARSAARENRGNRSTDGSRADTWRRRRHLGRALAG